MHVRIKGKFGLAAAGVMAAGLISMPAHAATQHCPMTEGSVKVETNGASNTVATGLEQGTEVCVKAGTQITYVTVGADGKITQTTIKNRKGKPLGISYYVYTPGTEEPPCEDYNNNGICDEDEEYPSKS